ncbi:T9SS sorting signal type C domain-containing protein [Flavobacterium sp. 17A]|uniref:T9SS sorting signal type C domain-containing protein n=1 Tax=Flavobacterium potami TaxID=2872310 RepID=A0A9X1H8S9_9FLAO|nr:T9SS sorting signal type C domain-containing protein [Flavobacterium potami]MBZ4034232.1 T9SS sorting signal type C domain-containing protein [Flavobacterium potami]
MKKLFLSALLFIIAAQYAVSSNSNPFLYRTPLGCKTHLNFEAESPQEIERHRVWLNLTNTEGLFKQVLIGYIEGATNGWDVNYDGISLDANKYADFYSINEGKKLVIQGRALPFDPSDTIPLGYRSAIRGNLIISIDRTDGDLAQKDIYLQDKETGTVHNLKNGPYTFYTNTGIFNDRFILRYSEESKLGVDEIVSNLSSFYISVKDRVITLNSEKTFLRETAVFDLNGKLLFSSQNRGESYVEIVGIQSNSQVLLVKATLEDGRVIARKVLF